MSTFHTRLLLEYLDGRNWMVVETFEYCPNGACKLRTDIREIRVPAGFVTDFASIPRFFWRVLPPTGSYGKAAVVHDYLYRTTTFPVTRKQADCIFHEAMGTLGTAGWVRSVMYRAVRVFGGRAFQPRH